MIPQTYAITYTPPQRPKTAPSRSRTVQARQMRVKRTRRGTSENTMANLWLYMYNHRGPVDVETQKLCRIAESVERSKTRNAEQEAEKRRGDESVARELNELRDKVAALQAQIAAAKTEAKSNAPEPAHEPQEQPEVLVQEA